MPCQRWLVVPLLVMSVAPCRPAATSAPDGESAAPAQPADDGEASGTVLATSDESAIELGSEARSVELPTPPAAWQRLLTLAAAPGRLRLALEGVRLLHPGVTYQVYLGLPAGAEPQPDGPHFVGHLALYAEPAETGDVVRSFEISKQVAALGRQGAPQGPLRVTFVPTASRDELAAAGGGPFFRLRRIVVLER